jgi:hypothetical protein
MLGKVGKMCNQRWAYLNVFARCGNEAEGLPRGLDDGTRACAENSNNMECGK